MFFLNFVGISMNIIIIGAGGVGFNLAKKLSVGNKVTIIDKNSEALQKIEENLDILTIKGDAEEIETYQKLMNKNFNLLISVTDRDNVNIVSTLIADMILEIERVFIRLKSHTYPNELIKKKLNIEKIISPIQLTSNSIISMLENHRFNNIKFFEYTPYKLISIRASTDIDPIKITTSNEFTIVGVDRERRFFIPTQEDVILPNDLVYIFGLESDITTVCDKLHANNTISGKNCVISGGDKLGIAIAKALIKKGKNVKIIEKNLALCNTANEELGGKASVIHTRYETSSLLQDEGIERADIFISTTNNDEYNIIKSLEAKERGIQKVISVLDNMEYYNLLHSLNILLARGIKMNAYNTIMEHINSNRVVVQKNFCGGRATVLMRKIFADSKFLKKELKPIKLDNALLFYIHQNRLYPFVESRQFQEGDLIILFCTNDNQNEIEWIYGL
jgi:trk system potassium uptake protein TrkA